MRRLAIKARDLSQGATTGAVVHHRLLVDATGDPADRVKDDSRDEDGCARLTHSIHQTHELLVRALVVCRDLLQFTSSGHSLTDHSLLPQEAKRDSSCRHECLIKIRCEAGLRYFL